MPFNIFLHFHPSFPPPIMLFLSPSFYFHFYLYEHLASIKTSRFSQPSFASPPHLLIPLILLSSSNTNTYPSCLALRCHPCFVLPIVPPFLRYFLFLIHKDVPGTTSFLEHFRRQHPALPRLASFLTVPPSLPPCICALIDSISSIHTFQIHPEPLCHPHALPISNYLPTAPLLCSPSFPLLPPATPLPRPWLSLFRPAIVSLLPPFLTHSIARSLFVFCLSTPFLASSLSLFSFTCLAYATYSALDLPSFLS